MEYVALAVEGGPPVRRNPYPNWPHLAPGDLARIREVLETFDWGGSSSAVSAFEQLFAQYHDATHGIAVSSGTMALELALHAMGIGPGDEVVVPAHSFVATATAVSRVGASPVFVDIEADTYNMDPARAAEAMTSSTKALLVVHFGGVVADVDRLGSLADQHGVALIEDAAHAHGAEWHGTRAGGLGLVAAFSFQNSKAMTAGEGGILTTSDQTLAARARSITNAGRRPGRGWFEHFELGTNLRITGLQAALLAGQLERLQDLIRIRQERFERFRRQLDGVDGIEFQRAPAGVTVQTRYIVPGRIDPRRFGTTRDRFVEAVQAEGVPVRSFYPHPLYRNPVFKGLEHRALQCPVAEGACFDSFWLPMRLFMGTEQDATDAALAIAKVHAAFQSRKGAASVRLPVT